MAASPWYQEKIYRAYMEFFERAERQRRWHVLDDIPWEKLDGARDDELQATRLEMYVGVELYLPDYTAQGLNLLRPVFGHAWFHANWSYEESKHALALRELLVRSGLRSEAQYTDYQERVLANVWNLPFTSIRQMICYGSLQELTTYSIYRAERERARREGDEVRERVFYLLGRDEAAHAGFYCEALRYLFEEDREGATADLADVLFGFEMPGEEIVPDYRRRLAVEGAGLSSGEFLKNAVFPTLRRLKLRRSDLLRARRRTAAKAAAPAVAS